MLAQMRRAVLGGMVTSMLLCGVAGAAEVKPAPGPVSMIVEFAIKDYDAWRPVFDAADGERQAAGVKAARVFREAGQPDHLLVLFTVESRRKGAAWMRSAKVKEAWRAGGVVGEPTFQFLR